MNVRDALSAALRKASTEVEAARRVMAAPFSSHDALIAYHRTLGVQQGLGIAIETYDQQEANNARCLCPLNEDGTRFRDAYDCPVRGHG